ncbi:RDD family protein [Demequina sp. NBRC 110053]|uniref:RDD family protein n=1 Tax=Demequina sp. NBRC 110053 TaxID=1570342 RepID=UPI0009FBC704|nr:RDD family protein [Demequina sp. NBRC 110053]
MDTLEDEILTGEGVALSTGAAAVTHRMLSGVLDLLVYGIPAMAALYFMTGATVLANGALQRAVTIAAMVVMLVLVPALVETLSRGRSVGRLACGLRVVRDDGGPVSFRHAFIRALTGLAEIFATFGVMAMTVSLLNARSKRLGDILAGTYSMRVRGAKRALPPLQMPPHLESWARTTDITRLPDGLALTSRMFLARAATLNPDSRARLGRDLSARLAGYVSPLPEPEAHPEYLIAAVLAERGRRESSIEARRQVRARDEAARVTRLPFGIPDAAD